MNENTTEQSIEMTAGEMLRAARTTGRRKREIPTIAKQLCIREEFLQALEDGNYTFIPEVVYILGFARNYAMELGLDPDEIVTKIKREMGLIADCATSSDASDGDAPSACALPDGGKTNFFMRGYLFVRRNWKWFLGGLVALIAVLVVAVSLVSSGDVEPVAENPSVPVAVSTEPAYKVAVRERFGTENRAKADVILQAVQESWVKVEDGRGNTVFSRVLVPGDVYYVPAGDKYKATFGNAGGIDAWVNGKLAPKSGANHIRKSGISLAPSALMAGRAE